MFCFLFLGVVMLVFFCDIVLFVVLFMGYLFGVRCRVGIGDIEMGNLGVVFVFRMYRLVGG